MKGDQFPYFTIDKNMLNRLFIRETKDANTRAVKSFLLQVLPGEDPVSKGEPDETSDFAGKSSIPQKGFIMVYSRWSVRTNNAVICGLCSKRTMVFIIGPY